MRFGKIFRMIIFDWRIITRRYVKISKIQLYYRTFGIQMAISEISLEMLRQFRTRKSFCRFRSKTIMG